MRTYVPLTLLLAWSGSLLNAAPLGTAFTYQGQLADAGQPADGVYDLRFAVYDAAADGAEIGGPLTNTAVTVSKGLFTCALDFGSGVFTGDARWLEIGVRPTGVGAFTVLSPRQPLTSTPYALSAGSVPGGTITTAMLANGAVTAAKIAPGAVSQLGTPNGADTNAVQVTNGGLVGIGTASPQAGLHLTSGRDLFAPTWLAELVDNRNSWPNLAGNCRVAASGNLLAVASFSDDALTLVDITVPAAPTLWRSVRNGAGAFTNLNGPSGLALSGSLLAVAANAESAVTLVDTSDPAAPVRRSVIRDSVGGFNDLNGAFAVDLTGQFLAVAAVGDHAVSLVDVTDPATPRLAGLMKDGFNGFDDLASPLALARQGNLLAIAAFSDNAVTLVDVSDPAAPARLATLRQGTGGFTNLTGPMAVALSGRLLAIAAFTDNAVTLVDISDPARPLRQATLRDGQGGFDDLAGASALQFQGDILWIAAPNDAALTAVDVSKPTAPALKDVLRDGNAGFSQLADLRSLAAAGNTLVAGAVSAVTLLDGTPVQVGLVSEGRVGIGTATPVSALHVVGNLFVEGAGLARLQAVHVELGDSTARGNYATALGSGTVANGDYSLAGGRNNVAEAAYSAIVAGLNNSIGSDSTNSFIGGGRDNVIQTLAPESVIVGGVDNVIVSTQRSAFIGGGARNEIRMDNQHAVIVGGRDNRIGTNTVISLVVGGGENHIGNNVEGGLMIGGFRNDITGSTNPNRRQMAPILIGGSDNEIDGSLSEVMSGGNGSSWTVILGGDNNRIGTNCPSAVIVGGTNNHVADNCGFSFAAGRRCRVDHRGSFMWADSQNASFLSAAENSFNIRSEGGVHLNADTSQFFGSSFRQVLNLYGTHYGIGVQELTHYARTTNNGSFSWYAGGTHSNTANSPGAGGTELMRLNSGGLRVNGTFVSASDRNQKANFQPVNPRDVLDKVAALPIAEWSYKQDAETRHVGPMAQDFRAAFGLGTDDKHIATVDADGVALAAIQGLNQRLNEKEAELQELKRAVAELKAALQSASDW